MTISSGFNIIKVCGALGPLGLWPKDKAFGLGYGPRSSGQVLDMWTLDLALGPWTKGMGPWTSAMDRDHVSGPRWCDLDQ